jgi:hypothetical protein
MPRLIGECVQEIRYARSIWENLFTPYQKQVEWPTPEQIKPLQGKSRDDILSECRAEKIDETSEVEKHLRFFCIVRNCGEERLHFLILPELIRQSDPRWWKLAIEKMVEDRFPALLQIPIWVEELKAVSRGTKADMLKELKDYSRDKVKQFA